MLANVVLCPSTEMLITPVEIASSRASRRAFSVARSAMLEVLPPSYVSSIIAFRNPNYCSVFSLRITRYRCPHPLQVQYAHRTRLKIRPSFDSPLMLRVIVPSSCSRSVLWHFGHAAGTSSTTSSAMGVFSVALTGCGACQPLLTLLRLLINNSLSCVLLVSALRVALRPLVNSVPCR